MECVNGRNKMNIDQDAAIFSVNRSHYDQLYFVSGVGGASPELTRLIDMDWLQNRRYLTLSSRCTVRL